MWIIVALLVVGGGWLAKPDLSLHADRPEPAQSGPAGHLEDDSPPLRAITWAPRGDLLDDEQFVAAALARVRQERPEVARLYFAGRLSDGSRLLLAGTDVEAGMVASSVHALHVPIGVPLSGALVTEATALTDPQQVLAWAARGTDGHVRVVVLTRPRPVRFELSGHVDFSPHDGWPTRRWVPVTAENGVVVSDLGPDADPIVAVRARGPGVFPLPLVVRVVEPDLAASSVVVVGGVSEPGYRGPIPEQLSRALRAQAGTVIDLATARIRVLWSGVPWRDRKLALLLLTRSDGHRFQALVGQQGDSAFPAGVRALPDDAPDRLPWLMEPFSPDDPTFLLCPTGGGTLIYRREGQPTQTLPIGPDGVVALVAPAPSPPSPGGAEVTLVDEQGRILIRTLLPPRGFADPLALD